VSETDFFRECEASFKQGAKFVRWVTGENSDAYYHPLMVPQGLAHGPTTYESRAVAKDPGLWHATYLKIYSINLAIPPDSFCAPAHARLEPGISGAPHGLR
jgi:hypothetical protein